MTTASRKSAALTEPLRRHEFPDGHLGWLATGHSACRATLADPRFSQRPLRAMGGVDDGGVQAALSGPESVGDLLRVDAPQHTRLRQLLTPYFTVRRAQERRADVERIVASRLEAMAEAGPPADFVQMFALPVPSMTICELLGVPDDDRDRFERPTQILSDLAGTTPDEKRCAMDAFYDYVRGVVEQKRARPGDDLLSDVIATGGLNDDELAGTAFFLFSAGHHTTATMFALSTCFLLADRERWESVRADVGSIDRTVEELLRYLNPVNWPVPRTAREDVEVDGVMIKAGETVAIRTAQPSGDPDKLADLDRFDPSRDALGHLAFGQGRHMCLGQHLARLELQVGLESLLRRFPTLRLAESIDEAATLRRIEDGVTNAELLVAW